MGPHLISGATALVLSFPCLISPPPPSHPSRLWKHLYGQTNPSSSVGLRQGVWVPSTPDGPAPMRHHLSYSRIAGGIGLASHVSDFLSYYPPPSRLNFHERNRNNCPQVAFSRLPAKPGSRLNSTSDSFWTWRGGRGLLDLVCVSCTTKRMNEIS